MLVMMGMEMKGKARRGLEDIRQRVNGADTLERWQRAGEEEAKESEKLTRETRGVGRGSSALVAKAEGKGSGEFVATCFAVW